MKRRTVITAGAAVAGTAAAAGVVGAPPASAFAADHLTVAERANARRSETIAARRLIFGVENVDPRTGLLPQDRVIISWTTNSSFVLAVAGRVILLDTFITRLEVTPGRTPVVIKDLVDVAPSAILLGHGHSDHAENAAYLAGKTGATLYASEETCGVMRSDFERISKDPAIQNDPVARFPRDATLKLVTVTTTGSVPGTQILRLKILEPFAQVVAFRHLHSIATPYDSTYPRNALIPADGVLPVDPRDAALFPPGVPLRPSDPPVRGQMDLRTGGGAGGPVAIFYNITLRTGSNFSLAWQDTIGALREGKGSAWPDGTPADGKRITDILKIMAPVDFFSAAVGTANFLNNGLRDLVDYQQALRPRVFVPNHQTTGGSDVGETKAVVHYAIYLQQLRNMGLPPSEWPDIRWTVDPSDYLKPFTFDAATPDPATRQRRRVQLRHFDGYPYAETRTASA
ncbi:MBL fold metallo-hydrolase [Actinoplanes sp. NPDC051513]|uniref:MBL fold metallo-hydrolase n=1 Tax=Actinoplanes sp. NPDC051513 TaxID=3363908 RepID=UPI0037B9C843